MRRKIRPKAAKANNDRKEATERAGEINDSVNYKTNRKQSKCVRKQKPTQKNTLKIARIQSNVKLNIFRIALTRMTIILEQ